MHLKSDNKENKIIDEADEFIKQLFYSYKIDTKTIWNQWKVVNSYWVMLIYCIINVIK